MQPRIVLDLGWFSPGVVPSLFTHVEMLTSWVFWVSPTNKLVRQAAWPSSCICTGMDQCQASPTPSSPQRRGVLGSWGLPLDATVPPCRQSPAWKRPGSSSSGNNIERNNELLWGRQEFSDWKTYGAVTVTDGHQSPFPTTLSQWPLLSPPGLSVPWCWLGLAGWS